MKLKTNVAANFLGQGWVVLMNFAFIPTYIKYLGIEAYGLIGFFIALQAWIVIVDLGLATTLSREMAIYSEGRQSSDSIRDFLRAIERVYVTLGALALVVIFLAAPYLAENWFRLSTLPASTIESSILLLGLSLVTRWASQVYRSAIQGLQRQVWLAFFMALTATVRAGGSILLLVVWEGSLTAFFLWNAMMSSVELAALIIKLYVYIRALEPHTVSPQPMEPLSNKWRFAASVFLTNLLAVVMTQSDKFLLSGVLTLADFGYYTFAYTAGTAAAAFTTPIFQAVAPRLSADVASGNIQRLVGTYHKACQTMAIVVIPAASIGIFNSRALINLWTNDPALSAGAASLASIFVAAYMLNSLIHVPAALALGHGWAEWGMYSNGIWALVVIPVLLVSINYFGAIGAATTNLLLNLGYYFISVRLLHNKILPGEWRNWFLVDTFLPMILALLLAAGLQWITPSDDHRWLQLSFFIAAWVAISFLTALTMPYPRSLLVGGYSLFLKR